MELVEMFLLLFLLLALVIFFRLYKSFGKVQYSNFSDFVKMKPATETVNADTNPSDENNVLTSKTTKIKNIYPDFVPEVFTKQSEQIFDEVFNAFASSQHQILKSKLSENLYEQFATQIQKREENNLRQELSISHKNTKVKDVKILTSTIEITVTFLVEQISAMIDINGNSSDNPNKLPRTVCHTWVFSSNITEKQNWVVIKTSAKEI